MSLARFDVRPDDGVAAEVRFQREMEARGYGVWRQDAYSQIALAYGVTGAEKSWRVRQLETGLKGCYNPTAMFWRDAPDYGLYRPPSECWMAEVKGSSPQHENLAIQVTQLLRLARWVLNVDDGLDVRYVYVPDAGPMLCRNVLDVARDVTFVRVNILHESYSEYKRLMAQTDELTWHWRQEPNRWNNDPYTLIAASDLHTWTAL